MSEIVGACLSQFHDDENSFELLLAYSDGREVGFSVSRNVAQKMASELANGAGCDPSAIERKAEPLEYVEKVSTEAAMSQWERSLKRPDLCEKDRVRGAIEAYKRQAFAFAISPTPPAAPVRVTEEMREAAHAVIWNRDKAGCSPDTVEAALRAALSVATSPVKSWPIDTDDQVEALARECDWDNRKYMTPKDYAIWCERMRKFARHAALSASPSPVDSRDALIERIIRDLRKEDDSDFPVHQERKEGWHAALNAVEEEIRAALSLPEHAEDRKDNE